MSEDSQLKASSSVQEINLIGPKQAEKLQRLNIETVLDLLYHFPVKYTDTSKVIPISQLLLEKEGVVIANIDEIKNIYTKSGMVITKAKISDDSGSAGVVWFNQKYLVKSIKENRNYLLHLKLPDKPRANDFYCKEYELVKGDATKQSHLGKITPVYEQTQGVSSKWLRARLQSIKKFIPELVEETLPEEIITSENLLRLPEAIKKIHFPKTQQDIEDARKRIAFEELYIVALKLERKRQEAIKTAAPKIEIKAKRLREFLEELPFELTADQKEALDEVLQDIQTSRSMYRLLNGDVGSGKTIVAVIASLMTALNDMSVLIMAPTTILAEQHYNNFTEYLDEDEFKIQLLTSGKLLEPTTKPEIIIGTHALLFSEHLPKNTGLIIIDEQHRFGVKQREQLSEISDELSPHRLSMTATPIPRTLTNVLYGDMDISTIKEMPKHRKPVKTHLVNHSKREECLKWTKEDIQNSEEQRQAFIIYPLVEESEKVDLKAATESYQELSETVFSDLNVALLHGRMSDEEKNQIIKDFREGEYEILVSTTVIEVGIDIPTASIMIIENAERFGLAQLHQLRGRIGRGRLESNCFIIPSSSVKKGSDSYQRLKYFANHPSGFDVAEYDLNRRGPGEIFGTKQSGLPNLKVASLTDVETLQKARKLARERAGAEHS